VVVSHRTEYHALVHPQRIGRTENQSHASQCGVPEIHPDGAHHDHELADESAGPRQSRVGHCEQHEKTREYRHAVDDAAVIRDVARMHAVIEHTYAQEERARDKSVRDHLNDRTFHSEGVEHEDAKRDEAHVRDR